MFAQKNKLNYFLAFLLVYSIFQNDCVAQLNTILKPVNLPVKEYNTKSRAGSKIIVDGFIQEEIWNTVPWETDFIQARPDEGKPPSFQTKFKVLYDDHFLYFAFRCYDSAPDSIDKRMGRRDEFPGDWIEVNIDSYHDLRSGFSFTLSVSGVRSDEFISNNGNSWDASWNPIWTGKTQLDNEGWTAEIKIPLSQFRYTGETEKVWGLQVTRRLFRKNERSTWVLIPQNGGVWVSGFGKLKGLNNIKMHRQIEIAPYITGQLDKYKQIPGNPFANGTNKKLTAGVDGKIAITNNMIVDFTVNPDFGQVTADPSQIRIDGFQNFFQEQRPFFVESRNIFEYPISTAVADGAYNSDLLFYSRRIGSKPHGRPQLQNGEYADVPTNTAILGAAKLSGKSKKGLSVGILESITRQEDALIDNMGSRSKQMVEPLTNYFVSRIQNDFKGGETILGGIFTSVNRGNNLNHLLHDNAISGGLDFVHFWKNRTWYIRSNFVFSKVSGSKETILSTQTNFEHLFQRPDANELEVDATRISLMGTGGTVQFGKSGGKPIGKNGRVFKFQTGFTFRSPELELNDIGFMLASNEINHFTWLSFLYPRSFSVFRTASLNYNHWARWDFGGKFLYQNFNLNGQATFNNHYQVSTEFSWNTFDVSNNTLRGGPALKRQPSMSVYQLISTDGRKKITATYNASYKWGFNNSSSVFNNNLTIRFQPSDAMSMSVGVGYTDNKRKLDQFVRNISYNTKLRSITSDVNQKTWAFTARLNYNITPDITLQYYGQPFITRPLFDKFAYVSDPMNKVFENRYHSYSPSQIKLVNGKYLIDENSDGITDYSFSNPDFNFIQFRSNLVARWEYIPGSELFLVWSLGNTPDVNSNQNGSLLNNLFDNLFTDQGRNSFLIKIAYRFLK